MSPSTHRPVPARGARCCGIVPPDLLRSVAERGTAQQRQSALRTLAVDRTLREERVLSTRARSASRLPADGPVGAQRTVSDAGGSTRLPGTTVRPEGGPPTGDAAADEAYDGLGCTFDLWSSAFLRNSIDGRGLALLATVHYDRDYDNAFWNGTQMVFGDGDGELFGRFTASLDVIGHELAHGVTEVEAGLVYSGQSGALNESMSDVFGSLVKQRALDQTADQADWLIGADLLRPGVDGVALRSMRAPGTAYDDPVLGKDRQPADMSGYVETTEDDGGVHLNSGIPNRAFYLAATAVGGRAWEVVGHVWYDTLLDERLQPEADFAIFAALTVDRAGRSSVAEQVRTAWSTVGIDVPAG